VKKGNVDPILTARETFQKKSLEKIKIMVPPPLSGLGTGYPFLYCVRQIERNG
jgi:hypothetical protein